MIRRSVAISTRGRISASTKKAITIATIGWIVYTSPVPGGGQGIVPDNRPPGGILQSQIDDRRDLVRKIVERDDNEIVEIIKIFMKCL